MPHSIFKGRPMPAPGEPLFLPEDTAAALALASEERDTCPSCGLPKAWCRDPDSKAGLARFDVTEDRCWATYRLALRREKHQSEKTHPTTLQALQMSVRFREAPDINAGLGLPAEQDGGADYGAQDR